MGYEDRDYARSESSNGWFTLDQLLAAARWWVRRCIDWEENPVTATTVIGFLLVNACWYGSYVQPVRFDARPLLSRHFALDATDLTAGRPYCYLTHGLLCDGSLPQAVLMLAGLTAFGAACERRVGRGWTAAALILGTLAGGGLHLFANSAGGQADWGRVVDWLRGAWGGGAAGAASEAFARLRTVNPIVCGPAGAITAAITVACVTRPLSGSRRENVWVAVAAVGFIAVDCLGWLRESGSVVGYGLRAGGLITGLLVATVSRLVHWRAYKTPRLGRGLAAGVLLALPLTAGVLASGSTWMNPLAPPAFDPVDLPRSCHWLERISRPLSDGPEVNQLKRREDVDKIAAEAGEVTDRAVRWELPVTRVTEKEIRFTGLYLVNARSVLPLPLDPDNPLAAFAQLDQAGDRMASDVHVQLLVDGHTGVSVPVTDDTRAFARTLTADSRVKVSATVRRIEFQAPSGENPFQVLLGGRCRYVIHLTEVQLVR